MAFVLGAKGSEEKAGHGAAFPQIGLSASRRDRFAYPTSSAGGTNEATLRSILGRFVSSASDSRFGQRRRRGSFAPTPAGGCTCPP